MKNKKAETLPATVDKGSFDLTITGNGTAPEMNPELAGEIEDNDFDGYDSAQEALPIVSIRQKPLADEKSGNVLYNAGGFRIYDPVTVSSGRVIPDQESLNITVLADQPSRVYWPQGNFDKPQCRSNDSKTGIGDPGVNCATCPKSQWVNGERPECTAQMNCLAYDHALQSCYILRLGRSALRPYTNFKATVKRIGNGIPAPLHTFQLTITTKYETEPAPHYLPVFQIERQIDIELFRRVKQLRQELNERMTRTVQVDTADDEHPAHNDMPTADPGGELPPGVEPVNTAPQDELPY